MTGYRERVAAALEGGWRFAGLHASAGGTVVRALLAGPDGSLRLEDVAADGGAVPSIVDLAPAAGWDEREAADLYGLGFTGHEPLRPLLDHGGANDRWTVRVSGADAYEIAVGPIHAGRDRVRPLPLPRRRRPDPSARCAAVLQAPRPRAGGGGEVARGGRRVRRARLRRVRRHERRRLRTRLRGRTRSRGDRRARSRPNDPARAGANVESPQRHRGRLCRSRSRRREQPLRGAHRACAPPQPGADRPSLPLRQRPDRRQRAGARPRGNRGRPRRARRAAPQGGERLAGARLQLLVPGPAPRHRCRGCGGCGTARRGRARRARSRRAPRTSARCPRGSPTTGSSRSSRSGPQATCRPGSTSGRSSSGSRSSCSTGCSPAPSPRVAATLTGPERQIGIGRVESPRGATSCVVERNGDRIERLRLRTGSYANWPVVAHAAADNLLPDFPLINKSFELCYACADR